MDDMFWLFLAVIACSYTIGGIASFGSSLLAIAGVIAFIGRDALTIALGVISCCNMTQAGLIVARTWNSIAWRPLGLIMVCLVLGLPLGHLFAHHLDLTSVQIALGLLLVCAGVLPLLRERPMQLPLVVRIVAMITAGAIHGGFASGGTIIIPYMRLSQPEKERFRATLSMVFVLLNAGLLVMTLIHDHSKLTGAPWLLLGAVAIVTAATTIGQRIATHINQRGFSRVVAAIMIAAGLAYLAIALIPDPAA